MAYKNFTAYSYSGTGYKTSSVGVETLPAAEGGEGYIYNTRSGKYMVKAYKNEEEDADTTERNKYSKCRYLLESNLHHQEIMLPSHLLFDEKDRFFGFMMPRARGTKLAELLNPMELRDEYVNSNVPGRSLGRTDLVDLCISILEKVCYLHHNNIVLCDLDPQNIMVDGFGERHPPRTYFVDCDSYQIGVGASAQYLGEVGKPGYVPRELIGKSLAREKRRLDSDYFALAVLLFTILVPNEAPYARVNGPTDITEGVRNGIFPYPRDPQGDYSGVPHEWCKCVWSHLPIGWLFWDNLHKDGSHYRAGRRTDASTWLHWMKDYRRQLTDGTIRREDPEGLKVFPERMKRTSSTAPKPKPVVVTKPKPIRTTTSPRPQLNQISYVDKLKPLLDAVRGCEKLDTAPFEDLDIVGASGGLLFFVLCCFLIFAFEPYGVSFEGLSPLGSILFYLLVAAGFAAIATGVLAIEYVVHRLLRRRYLRKNARAYQNSYDEACKAYSGSSELNPRFERMVNRASRYEASVDRRTTAKTILFLVVDVFAAIMLFPQAMHVVASLPLQMSGVPIIGSRDVTWAYLSALAPDGSGGQQAYVDEATEAIGEQFPVVLTMMPEAAEAPLPDSEMRIVRSMRRDGDDIEYGFTVTYTSQDGLERVIEESIRLNFDGNWTEIQDLGNSLQVNDVDILQRDGLNTNAVYNALNSSEGFAFRLPADLGEDPIISLQTNLGVV